MAALKYSRQLVKRGQSLAFSQELRLNSALSMYSAVYGLVLGFKIVLCVSESEYLPYYLST